MKKYGDQQEKDKCLKVKSYYDQLGNISNVATYLGMSYSETRAFLRRGHRWGLFTFDEYNTNPTNKITIGYLYRTYTKIIVPPVLTTEENVQIKEVFDYNPNINSKNCKAVPSARQKNLIISLFKKYKNIRVISSISGFSMKRIFNILHRAKEIHIEKEEVTHEAKKLSEEKIGHFRLIQEMYSKLGTLEKVGKELNLTRERVRQILIEGARNGLFEYKPRGAELEKLKQELDKDYLIREIKLLKSKTKLCFKFNINMDELENLLSHFDIDFREYRKIVSMGRYLQEYSEIVDKIGYHPTTTELNSRLDWRKVWAGIDRYWGSIDNFRKEFGIDKPKMNIHQNTLNAWNESIEKRVQIKKQKKERLIQFIKAREPVSSGVMKSELGLLGGNLSIYLNELLREGLISRIGVGSQTKYIVNKIGTQVSTE